MVCSWNKLVAVILMLSQMTSFTQCSCDWRVPYFPVYYPTLGESIVVEAVVGPYKHYTWRKDGRPLATKTCQGSNDPNCTILLNLRNVALEDSGKYILELFCSNKGRRVNSFEIIVQDKPFVSIDCNDMTVYEGDSVTCVCKTSAAYPTAVVTWLRTKPEQGNLGVKNFTDILILRNISKNESGTYTCFAKSGNFVNKTSFNLRVVQKNPRVQIKYFKVLQEIRVSYGKLSLLCKAEGIPEPIYTISHNGTTVKHENIFTVDTREISSLGQYECLARNIVSSDRRLLFLNASFLVKPCLDEEKGKTEAEWKTRIIIGACSFLAGILLLNVLMCFCKKCNKKDDHYDNSEYDDVRPRKAQETLGPASKNHEMRLRHTSDRPGNEEERDSAEYDEPETGNNDEHYYYNESNYHEFDGFRHYEEERYRL